MAQLVSTPALAFLVLVAICLMHTASCKVYTICGLHDELVKRKFSRSFIPNWVCLIDAESRRDTSRIGTGPAGSEKFGLFQINSRDYCRKGSPGGLCKAKCEDFLDENITDDIKCAQLIYNTYGFKAWDGWTRACKNRNLGGLVSPCLGGRKSFA